MKHHTNDNPKIELYQADCLEIMPQIDDKSIDMILCDLPYGTTACKWDTIIPFEPLWKEYKRIIKDNGAIVLTASQPFTSALVMSNLKMFKYEWIWSKNQVTNFLNAKHQPLKEHESILVFYKKKCKYIPQMTKGKIQLKNTGKKSENYRIFMPKPYFSDNYFPKTILFFPLQRFKGGHPTQKPVALFEYLIKTYTNEGDLVLDNCAGSGTTGIASIKLKRNCIMIEISEKYCDVIKERVENELKQLTLNLQGVIERETAN